MVRTLFQLGSHLDPFGDVSGVDDYTGHCRVSQQVGGHDLHVAPASLCVGHPCLGGRRHARAGDHLSGSGFQYPEVAGMD